MKKSIVLVYLIFIIHSCILENAYEKRDITFINKGTGTVYCLRSKTDSLKNYYLGLDEIAFEELFKIPKDSSLIIPDKPASWNGFIEGSQDGKLRFFIISKDSVDKYGWQKIITQNIYTKVYKVNIEDLNKLKWTITYKDK